MTGHSGSPVIDMAGVMKHYGGAEPLRVRRLEIQDRDELTIAGLSAGAAEMFMHLVTGAALPEEGHVRVAGRDTRDIATDTEWLASLDRFGIVTHRAVLIEKLPVAASLALPITLAIDPMTAATRAQIDALADAVHLGRARLDVRADDLSRIERARIHLARALAMNPSLLLLERPTDGFESSPDAVAFGQTLRAAATARRIGWVAISEDPAFARGARGTRLILDATTGGAAAEGFWPRLFSRSRATPAS